MANATLSRAGPQDPPARHVCKAMRLKRRMGRRTGPFLVSIQLVVSAEGYAPLNSRKSASLMPALHTSSRISPLSAEASFGDDRVPLAGVHSGLTG